MNAVQFPIKCEVSIYLTDGTNFARASGPEITGDILTKEGALQAVAAAVLATERTTQLTGWRLPTPKEFLGEALRENFGMRVAVPTQPKDWPGFSSDELTAEIERQRAGAETADDDEVED
jgi:hypothetical protein